MLSEYSGDITEEARRDGGGEDVDSGEAEQSSSVVEDFAADLEVRSSNCPLYVALDKSVCQTNTIQSFIQTSPLLPVMSLQLNKTAQQHGRS